MSSQLEKLVIELKEKYKVVENRKPGCASCPLNGGSPICPVKISSRPVCSYNIGNTDSFYIKEVDNKENFMKELKALELLTKVHA